MMKIYLSAIFCILFSTCLWAQKNTTAVPMQVSQQFSHRFGKIQQVEWNTSGREQYQAAFLHNGIKKTALFANSGQWLVIENRVSAREIPVKVNQSLAKEFPGYQISEATRMELFGKGTAFRIRVRKGPGIFDVEIDVNGQVSRREEVYTSREENDHHHHHDDCYHDCDHHHHKKHKHKHKRGKGHSHHEHDDDDD